MVSNLETQDVRRLPVLLMENVGHAKLSAVEF